LMNDVETGGFWKDHTWFVIDFTSIYKQYLFKYLQ